MGAGCRGRDRPSRHITCNDAVSEATDTSRELKARKPEPAMWVVIIFTLFAFAVCVVALLRGASTGDVDDDVSRDARSEAVERRDRHTA